MEQTNMPITEAPKRPQFLTVLCILTYIGVGLGIIGSIAAWWGMRAMSTMMDATSQMAEGMEGLDMSSMPEMEDMMTTFKWINVTTLVGIGGCILCLIGALQMWKLKKIGFYLYAVGEVVPFIVSAVLLGNAAFEIWPIILGAVIPVVFLILYGLNLKHLS